MHCATFPIFLYVVGQPPLNRHTAEIPTAGIKMCVVKKELHIFLKMSAMHF